MNDTTTSTPFKREDHVYHNEAFAELCKDAVRAFNGTPVCELPPPRFTGSGVYAIYCTARKGIYERYGNKVNRMGYNVPIYVGKAVPQGWRQSRAEFHLQLSIWEQLKFWHDVISMSIGISIRDFKVRLTTCECVGEEIFRKIYPMLVREYKPLWNRIFTHCPTSTEFFLEWQKFHSIRFKSRADQAMQQSVVQTIERICA